MSLKSLGKFSINYISGLDWNQRYNLFLGLLVLSFFSIGLTYPYLPMDKDIYIPIREETPFENFIKLIMLIEIIIFLMLSLITSYCLGRSKSTYLIKEKETNDR